MENIKFRLEEEKDYKEVENLIREAFWNVYRPGCFEHYVIHKLHSEKCFEKSLTYLAEKDGKIIAAIFYSLGSITRSDGVKEDCLTFGPVGVLPEYQKRGYGKAIIEFSMKQAEKQGFDKVVITGNPDYYKQFGFEPAFNYGIHYIGMDENDEAPFFMCKVFKAEKKISGGTYTDPECFETEEKEVDKFDKNFPPKKKEKLPGQLC